MEICRLPDQFPFQFYWHVAGISADQIFDNLEKYLTDAFELPIQFDRMGAPKLDIPGHSIGNAWIHGFDEDRVVSIVQHAGSDGRFIACYPWRDHGVQTAVKLAKLEESPSELEALVTADYLGVQLTFLDLFYPQLWQYYAAAEVGDEWEFILSGLATTLQIVVPSVGYGITRCSDEIPNLCQFLGKVLGITETTICGRPGWNAEVRVLGGEWDFRLPIHFVPEAVEGGLPKVGDQILGKLLLQGRAWLIPSAVGAAREH